MAPRLTVHVGSRKTATTWVQNALGRNEEAVRAAGVHLPASGRFTLNPGDLSHHHLGFDLAGDPRFDPEQGGWDALAAEIAETRPEHVFVTCEVFEAVVTEHGGADRFIARLRSISDDIRVVLVVRHTASMLNSMYNQFVKMFVRTDAFAPYLEVTVERGATRLLDHWRPVLEAPDVDLRVLRYRDLQDPNPLVRVMGAAGVDLSGVELDLPTHLVNTSLGPVGVEVTRVLGRYLQGRHPEWTWHGPASQHLHMESLLATTRRGWNDDRYWAWTPELVERYEPGITAELDAFAQAVWGEPWGEPWPHVAPTPSSFEDFPPDLLDDAMHHLATMSARWERLLVTRG